MDVSALQYGALGLLLMVLVGVGMYLREDGARRQAASDEDRSFMRELIKDMREERQRRDEAFTTMVKASTSVQTETVTAIREVREQMVANERRAAERHVQLLNSIVGKENLA